LIDYFSDLCYVGIPGCTAYNLGTGQGTSVLEMVAAFEKASGKVIAENEFRRVNSL